MCNKLPACVAFNSNGQGKVRSEWTRSGRQPIFDLTVSCFRPAIHLGVLDNEDI
jgi:hypothetical protein